MHPIAKCNTVILTCYLLIHLCHVKYLKCFAFYVTCKSITFKLPLIPSFLFQQTCCHGDDLMKLSLTNAAALPRLTLLSLKIENVLCREFTEQLLPEQSSGVKPKAKCTCDVGGN